MIAESTIDETSKCLGISHGSVPKIVGKLGFRKVRTTLAMKQLTDAHQQAHLEACLELLECSTS